MGLLSCVRPADAVPGGKKAVIVDLEAKRSALQQEVTRLQSKIVSHDKEAALFASERDAWTQLRSEHEGALQSKTAAVAQLVERTTRLGKELETDAAGQDVQAHAAAHVEGEPLAVAVEVHAYEPEGQEEAEGRERGEAHGPVVVKLAVPASASAAAAAAPAAESSAASAAQPGPSPEALLDAALTRLERGQRHVVAQLRAAAEAAKAEDAKRQAADERTRSQAAIMELRCSALEAESTALSSLNAELQHQIERLQQEQTVAQATTLGSHARLQVELQAKTVHADTLALELETTKASLLAVTQELADRDRGLLDLQAASAAEASALAATLATRDAELQELRDARAIEAAQRAEAQAALTAVRRAMCEAASEAAGLRSALAASRTEVMVLEEARAKESPALADATLQLAAARRMLGEAEGRERAAVERAAAKEASAAAGVAELAAARTTLAELQLQAGQRAHELSTMLGALKEAQERALEADRVQAAAKASVEAAERSLQDMTAQYVAAKRDLIAASKQMASMAAEHSNALDKFTDCSSQLSTSQQEVQALEARVQAMAQESAASARRLRELELGRPALEAELSALRAAHALAAADVGRMQAMLKAIARISSKGAQVQDMEVASLTAYYEAAVNEDCLKLRLSDTPIGLCGSLFTVVADSRQLASLVLDMDSSRETVWEKTGLRVACLSAALGLNSSLRTLELSGWTWTELGNGCALPFLTLGSMAGSGALTTVKIDTKLFDVDCASALLELLQRGLVELKRPGGQGVLRLYSDNEDLDEWYGVMIQDAVDPSWAQQQQQQLALQPSQQQQQLSRIGSLPSPSPPPASRHFRHQSLSLSTAATSVYDGGATVAASSASMYAASVSGGSMALYGGQGAGSGSYCPSPGSYSSSAETGAMTTPSKGPAGVLLSPAHRSPAADAPDALTDLSNKGLDSHHMVVVMAVLVSCPHLKRLRLDGNKVGNAGAELLSLGLSHNCWLRELLLSRNSITAPGARKLARALERNVALRRLDLSSQRFEGLGPSGAEAVASALRTNTTLEELNVTSNSLGAHGAALLAGGLRAAHPTCALKRLGASLNGFDSASARALEQAAAERGVVVTV